MAKAYLGKGLVFVAQGGTQMQKHAHRGHASAKIHAKWSNSVGEGKCLMICNICGV